MNWLLWLYPPRWRRRYGAELAELVAAQRFSFGGAADLMAGAIDAWFHPELIARNSTDMKGDTAMIASLLQCKSAGYGPDVSRSDRSKSIAVTLGGTLILTLLWMWAVWQYRRNPYVLALAPMIWLIPYLFGLRYTALKGRSGRAQTIFIAGLVAAMAAVVLFAGWIGTRI